MRFLVILLLLLIVPLTRAAPQRAMPAVWSTNAPEYTVSPTSVCRLCSTVASPVGHSSPHEWSDSLPAPSRAEHARKLAVRGAVGGGVLGVIGGSLYNVGCDSGPGGCSVRAGRLSLMVFTGAEGAALGAVVGSLIGWAWR
jgi:hypothetical protein